MALRTIRVMGDEILTKQCRPVKEMTPRIKTLIEDMLETMYDAEGVGLAAPQVGILKQICVIDVTPECDHPIVLVNPEIIELSGEQIGQEGCLSVPGKVGIVKRANSMTNQIAHNRKSVCFCIVLDSFGNIVQMIARLSVFDSFKKTLLCHIDQKLIFF